MIRSMTAFSRKDQQIRDDVKQLELSWEIRTVNHRYLDVSLSLPEAFNADENKLKELIRNKIGRGKFDAKLSFNTRSANSGHEISLNEANVKALLSARHMLESISKKPVALSGMDILNWPGVIEEKQEGGDNYIDSVISLLDITLDDLIATRESEGERILDMITSRCELVTELVGSVRQRRPVVISSLREKVLKKLSEIEVEADSNRLEQELVFQAQRLDVDEELDRIDSHIEEVMAVLKRDEPVGRRLDFLMQELNREANTLSSKSNDSETTRSAVELKVLIEQMREQCLNIE